MYVGMWNYISGMVGMTTFPAIHENKWRRRLDELGQATSRHLWTMERWVKRVGHESSLLSWCVRGVPVCRTVDGGRRMIITSTCSTFRIQRWLPYAIGHQWCRLRCSATYNLFDRYIIEYQIGYSNSVWMNIEYTYTEMNTLRYAAWQASTSTEGMYNIISPSPLHSTLLFCSSGGAYKISSQTI